MKKLIMIFIAAITTAATAFAQEAAEAAPVSDAMTWQQIIETGGVLIYCLAGMSIIGFALVVYFFMTLRREQILPASLVEEVGEQFRKGDYTGAEKTCASRPCALSSIALAAVRHKMRVENTEIGLLRETLEGEGGRQATLLQNQTQYLLDIAIIAPMVGLLGTVMGMLRAFNSVALDVASARPLELAEGVSQALVTTVAGLIVAIPAMVAYAYFRGRTSKIISDLESAAADLAAEMQESVDS